MKELWLPVVGFEGLYEVSNHGRVKRLAGTRRGKGDSICSVPERILVLNDGPKQRYALVMLAKDGKRFGFTVHRLVMEAFVGPRPEDMEVRHGPGGPKDNRLCNLSYGTKSQNELDKYRDGTMTCGEKRFNAVLNASLAREIKLRHQKGEPVRQIAEHLRLPINSVKHCAKHRSWKHISV